MKTLRVVSGLHAGASLTLSPGTYRVGGRAADSLPEAAAGPAVSGAAMATAAAVDIDLCDWSEPPLLLSVDSDHRVGLVRTGGPEFWPDFQPRRYGTVVLCTGDADQSWPSDTSLLAMLGPRRRPERDRTGSWIGSWVNRAVIVGVGLLVAVGALYGRSDDDASALPPPQPALGAQWLSRSLDSRGLNELVVRELHGDVLLGGLVRDARQGQSVRLAVADMRRSTGMPVTESWEVADEIASTIESALRLPGLHARYRGAGQFEVSGTVADPSAVQQAVVRLRKDLGGNVRGIDLALERIQPHPTVSVAVLAGALHYSERPDGAKVFAANAP